MIRNRMCQKIVQLSPNANPLDRRQKTKTPGKSHVKTSDENDTHQKEQRSRRVQTTTFEAWEESSSSIPQAHVFADIIWQLLTRLKADTAQTASYIKKTTFELRMKVYDVCLNIPLSAKQCQIVRMRHEAEDLPSCIGHAASDGQASI